MPVIVIFAAFVVDVPRLAMGGVQKLGLELCDPLQVEPAASEDHVQGHVRTLGAVDGGEGVQPADPRLNVPQLGLAHQVGLVQDDLVGKGDLFDGLPGVPEAQGQVEGIDHRRHAVQFGTGPDIVVDEEGLGDGPRVGEACGFNDDGVEAALALHEAGQHPDEVAAHRAADASVVHLEDFLVGADDEVVVDSHFAELVDDDRIAPAMVLREYAVQERGLAGAEIAGEDGDRGLLIHGPFSNPSSRPGEQAAQLGQSA